MKHRLLALAAGLLLLPATASAQTLELTARRRRPGPGIVAPTPMPLPQQRQQVQLKYLGVDATVEEQVAITKIDQTFHNPNNWIAEGTYLFPLPEGTSVSSFVMYMGGKAVKGEVLDRDKAARIYESIVRSRKDPGLLEFVGHRLIRARVFPIPARGDVRIKLEFTRVLTADSGLYEYNYPLSSAGNKIGEASFSIRLKSKTPIKTVYSPSHPVHTTRTSDHEVLVRYEKRGLRPERSLNLMYGLSDKALGLNVLTHRRAAEDGYFMLAISPKVAIAKDEITPKSMIFVIDTSGSMAGEKMDQARKALAYCVNSLDAKSHFNIVRFSTEVEALSEQMLGVDARSKKKALRFIDELEAAGGTNIDEALEKALALAGQRDGLVEVVFLTDGKPTIGERTPKNILSNVKSRNKNRTRLFVFGVGSNLNTHLLDKLAEANRGVRTYVTEGESIERKVSSFYTKIASPVLTDLTLALGKLKVKDVYPRRLPDLFRGGQLLVFGRYKTDGAEPVTLAGKVAGRDTQFVYEADFGKVQPKHAFLPRLWAQRKIGHLLDQIRLHGESPELKTEVIALAKKFGIVTPYTSALVLEDGATPQDPNAGPVPPGRGRRLGFSGRPGGAEGAGGGAPAEDALRAKSGKKAVTLSQNLKKLKESESLEESKDDDQAKRERQVIRKIADKTFVKQADGFWVETTLVGQKDKLAKATKLAYLSKEYFAWVKAHAGVNRYLKIGAKLVIEVDGTVFKIE